MSNTRVLEYAYIPKPLQHVRVLFNMKRIHTVFIWGGEKGLFGDLGGRPLLKFLHIFQNRTFVNY